MIKRAQNYFWLALIGHLLLFLFFTTSFVFSFKPDPPEADEQKGTVVPSYIYHDKQLSQLTQQSSAQAAPKQSTQITKNQETAKNGLEKPQINSLNQNSSLENQNTQSKAKKASRAVSIPNLISEKKIDKPLLKILSKATAEKLTYPKSASDFGVTGKVTIGFLLFPSGLVSDVSLLKSSGSGVLDQAALTTINSISPVQDVGQYIQDPEYLVVGIIYG